MEEIKLTKKENIYVNIYLIKVGKVFLSPICKLIRRHATKIFDLANNYSKQMVC